MPRSKIEDVTTRARRAVVRFFSDDPDRAERALRRHVADEWGYCVVCSTQRAERSWPCLIFKLASLAVERGPAT